MVAVQSAAEGVVSAKILRGIFKNFPREYTPYPLLFPKPGRMTMIPILLFPNSGVFPSYSLI